MSRVIENYSKFEVRMVARFLQAEGVGQNEIHCRLVSVCGKKVWSRKEVSVWCNKVEDGRMALNDVQINTDTDHGICALMKIVSLLLV